MARYELRPIGVFDRELGIEVRRGERGWEEYHAWLEKGGICDPMLARSRPPIDERRREIAARVNAERAEILFGATTDMAGEIFDADPQTVARLALAIALGVKRLQWRTKGNQLVTLSGEQLAEVGRKVFERTEEIFWRSWQLKDQVIATSEDPEKVDIKRGWGRDDPPPVGKPLPERPRDAAVLLPEEAAVKGGDTR